MTTTASPEELARLAVDSLQRVKIDPGEAANMSRRRFICIQTNSILIALLTCLTIGIVTLFRVSTFNEIIFGKCGAIAQLLSQKNYTFFSQYCSSSNFSINFSPDPVP
jgi:hypothetical protein